MMLVRCTSCNALVGFGNNLTFGPDTELVCFECAGDTVFGSGKDGGNREPAVPLSRGVGSTPTVPANPAAVKRESGLAPTRGAVPAGFTGPTIAANSPEPAHPSNGGGARFFGGACKQCGANVYLPFDPQKDPLWLDQHPSYFCSSCYVRVGGEGE